MGALNNCWQRVAGPLIGVMLGGFVVTGSFTFFNQPPKQPHENLGLKVLTPAVVLGERLVVRASGIRNRICVVFMARSFKDMSTGFVVHKETTPGGFNDLGPWAEEIAIKLPSDMGVGDYQLRLIQNNDCGEEVYPLKFPPVTFSIVSHR